VSARSLELNPAVSFLAVLAFGAVFGALGAFLALPVAATIQAVSNVYLQRHELIDSEMLREEGDARQDQDADANESDGRSVDAGESHEDTETDADGDERPVMPDAPAPLAPRRPAPSSENDTVGESDGPVHDAGQP
jgi:hypothetical protein